MNLTEILMIAGFATAFLVVIWLVFNNLQKISGDVKKIADKVDGLEKSDLQQRQLNEARTFQQPPPVALPARKLVGFEVVPLGNQPPPPPTQLELVTGEPTNLEDLAAANALAIMRERRQVEAAAKAAPVAGDNDGDGFADTVTEILQEQYPDFGTHAEPAKEDKTDG